MTSPGTSLDGRVALAPLLKKACPVSPASSDPISHALGSMGLWQLRAVVLVALVKVPAAWHMANILFIAPAPRPEDFWCAAQGQAANGHQRLVIPHAHHTLAQRDPCKVYHSTTDDWFPINISTSMMNLSIIPCPHFEFQRSQEVTNTAVMQWQLVCEREVLVGVSQFFYLLGILVGGFLCWKLLFRFSPRKIMLCGMLVQVLTGTGMAYVPQYECHVALRFLCAVAVAHMFTAGYIICTDITNGRWRTIVGACYEHMWSVGVITLPLVASLFSDWRDLQVAISLPTSLVMMAYRWVPESPRWLLTHGYIVEAQSTLREAALYNGTDVSRVDAILHTAKRKSTGRVKWIDLFRTPNSKLHMLALHIVWATTVAAYYEGLLNVKNLGDNLYINFGIAGAVEIVGVFLGLRLMWFSKKWPALGMILLAGGFTSLLSWCLPMNEPWMRDGVLVLLAMMGRIATACSLTVLQEGSPDLLPREFRPMGTLSCVTFARAFLLITFLFVASLVEYGECGPLSAFAVFSLLGGFGSLFLNYTKEQSTKHVACGSQDCSGIAQLSTTLDINTDSAR